MIEGTDALEMVHEGHVEDVAEVLEALLQRIDRMSDRDASVIASILRGRGTVSANAVDMMTDIMLSID